MVNYQFVLLQLTIPQVEIRSPALNSKGELVGLNFDRAWEGTMSDINYDASRCRNIMVDARYILFIIDKYANADYLLDEMTIN